uniref:Tripartite motif containing 38 n=1 Tax=Canis lupus dingo TaxID=286419 RepID=A0A8C0K5L8_CANLU
MASAPITKRMKGEATCAICLQLMSEPMSISCGHSYCTLCIISFLENLGHAEPSPNMFPCPHCRASFHLIEAIKEMEREMSCEEHGEHLHLFCEDESQLICWCCERSPRHKGHHTALIEDVSQDYKEKLQNAVTNLKQLEEECMKRKVFTTKQISEWNEKIEIQKQKIQSDFKNLQSFLLEEEKSYLWRLEKERDHILELEEKCQGSPQKLLQKPLAFAYSRTCLIYLFIYLFIYLLTYLFTYLLTYLLIFFSVSVTLDPDTAHHELILSEDRRQVTRGYLQDNLKNSSKRFSVLPCILGCEGFTSGRHYFEVDVGEGTGWDLGVCLDSVQRDVGVIQKPQSGFWAIRLCKKKGYVALTSPVTSLYLREQPLVVGIFSDCDIGVVSFYNMTPGSHIFTFPKTSSSDTVWPYFWVYQHSPLFLPPPDE